MNLREENLTSFPSCTGDFSHTLKSCTTEFLLQMGEKYFFGQFSVNPEVPTMRHFPSKSDRLLEVCALALYKSI